MSDKSAICDNDVRTGRCLCGAVRFSATLKKPHVGACHCDTCRRWSSAPFMEVECRNARFEGEEHIRRYRSSDWAERGFCERCGSNLFYHIVDSHDYAMAAGLLDDAAGLTFTHQVYVDRKPQFYSFAEDTRMLTEADVVAMFAPPGTPPR